MTEATPTRIAVIGLGNMGEPMAGRWQAAGYEVRGCDVSEQARARLESAGGRVSIERGVIPADWPVGQFDLIVVSEVGYYVPTSLMDWSAHFMAHRAPSASPAEIDALRHGFHQ